MSDESAVLLPEMEITFDEAIEFSGKSVTSIILREPKAREVQAALTALGAATTPDSMFKYNVALISSVSGQPRQIIEQIPIRQFNTCAKYLEAFLA